MGGAEENRTHFSVHWDDGSRSPRDMRYAPIFLIVLGTIRVPESLVAKYPENSGQGGGGPPPPPDGDDAMRDDAKLQDPEDDYQAANRAALEEMSFAGFQNDRSYNQERVQPPAGPKILLPIPGGQNVSRLLSEDEVGPSGEPVDLEGSYCGSIDFDRLNNELKPWDRALNQLSEKHPLHSLMAAVDVPLQLLVPVNILLRTFFHLELVPSFPHHSPYLKYTHMLPPNLSEWHCTQIQPKPPQHQRPVYIPAHPVRSIKTQPAPNPRSGGRPATHSQPPI